MFQNCIRRDITGYMGTILSITTQARLAQLVGKGARNQPSRQTLLEGAHQVIIESKLNYR